MKTLLLPWEKLDPQSRQELCEGAGVDKKISEDLWENIEPMVKERLDSSLRFRSGDRVCLILD